MNYLRMRQRDDARLLGIAGMEGFDGEGFGVTGPASFGEERTYTDEELTDPVLIRSRADLYKNWPALFAHVAKAKSVADFGRLLNSGEWSELAYFQASNNYNHTRAAMLEEKVRALEARLAAPPPPPPSSASESSGTEGWGNFR